MKIILYSVGLETSNSGHKLTRNMFSEQGPNAAYTNQAQHHDHIILFHCQNSSDQ